MLFTQIMGVLYGDTHINLGCTNEIFVCKILGTITLHCFAKIANSIALTSKATYGGDEEVNRPLRFNSPHVAS